MSDARASHVIAEEAFQPIRSAQSAAAAVAARLHEMIVTGALEPGAQLPAIATLARSFNVSVGTVREALSRLEASGLIDVRHGQGTYVLDRPPTEQAFAGLRIFFGRAIGVDVTAVREAMEVRRGIEVEAAMIAAERRTADDLARLLEIVKRMRDAVAEPSRYSELDLAFHLEVAAATHNEILYHLVQAMRDSILDSIRQSFSRLRQEFREQTQELHEAVFAAVERQEVEAARLAMNEHFAVPLTELLEQEQQAGRGAAP